MARAELRMGIIFQHDMVVVLDKYYYKTIINCFRAE